MIKLKFAICAFLISVIATGCIKNKQNATTEDTFELSTIENNEFSVEDSIIEDSATITFKPPTITEDNDEESIDQSEKIFTTVDAMPEFTGGAIAMKNFFKENLSSNVDVEGRVIVRFVVDKRGNIKDPTILRSLSQDCDKEAIRVVNEMPQWTPGKKKGVAVSVYYTLPVLFRK